MVHPQPYLRHRLQMVLTGHDFSYSLILFDPDSLHMDRGADAGLEEKPIVALPEGTGENFGKGLSESGIPPP